MAATVNQERQPVEGAVLCDGDRAQRGDALNDMCCSLKDAANREAFRQDENAYCRAYNLTPDQRKALANRDISGLIAAGGSVAYLAMLADIWGLAAEQPGAQTGMSVDAFKAKLLSCNRYEGSA